MNKRLILAWVMLTCLVCGFTAQADVLLIEDVELASTMRLPGNGISKAQVLQNWGEPVQQYSPVGEPPITRWRFDDYSVYFEYDRVISTVLHQQQAVASNNG